MDIPSVLASFKPRSFVLSEIAQEYLTLRDIDQKPPTVALSGFLSLAGDRDVSEYTREDAKLFVRHLEMRGNKTATIVQIRRTGFPAVIAGLSLVAAYSGGIYAIQSTSVANAMLLFATAPFMAAVLGWLVLREPVRLATWVAIAVAIAGIAIMVADKSGGIAVTGSLAALASAFGFAVFTVALRWGKSDEMLPSVFLSGLFGIIVISGTCLFLELSLVLSIRDGGIAMGMGVFQVGAGLILYTLGSRSLPAAELALLSMAEVLLGLLWVWMFIGETATLNTLTGGAVLLAAISGNALSGKRRKLLPMTSP